ncbi:MAG: hypothetical protein GY866_28305, partial [Proteobacteria bacterium]|nr:hypothetical protein [Pseudomonadota bacterium]
KDGEHTLVYAALDRVENAEQNSDYTFYLDNTPPELKPPALLGDIYEKDLKLYVSGSSTIELGATDNKAGVRRIRYNFDKQKSRIYSEPFSFPQRNGKTTFYYAASDNVINISKKENQTVIVDISTPKVTASFHGKHYVKQNVHYIRKSTGIGLDATDNLSGIKSISYDTKTGSSEAVLNAFDGQPFMILDEGEHVFSFRAIDNVNNRSEDHQLRLFVDEIAPDVFHHFSAQKISEDEEIYPKKIKLYLAATDKQAGVKQMYYKVNKAAEKRYKAPITFSKKGTFTISVRAVDRVANSSQVKISFKVK